jgi:hypothetical protein
VHPNDVDWMHLVEVVSSIDNMAVRLTIVVIIAINIFIVIIILVVSLLLLLLFLLSIIMYQDACNCPMDAQMYIHGLYLSRFLSLHVSI